MPVMSCTDGGVEAPYNVSGHLSGLPAVSCWRAVEVDRDSGQGAAGRFLGASKALLRVDDSFLVCTQIPKRMIKGFSHLE